MTDGTLRTIAILVLRKNGLRLAARIQQAEPEFTTIFGPTCVVGRCGVKPTSGASLGDPPPQVVPTETRGVFGWTGPLRRFLPDLWERFDAILGVMPLETMVRRIGPLATGLRREPAVVVVDESGRFAVSVLPGSVRAADEFTRELARRIGATPVVTGTRNVSVSPDSTHQE